MGGRGTPVNLTDSMLLKQGECWREACRKILDVYCIVPLDWYI
jgi:hypothetical protein